MCLYWTSYHGSRYLAYLRRVRIAMSEGDGADADSRGASWDWNGG